MTVIRTLAEPVVCEPPKIKGSRFIAALDLAVTVDEATAFVEAKRAEFRDATHNCFAWRLDDGENFRFSDDGEPSGSAGRPMLREIEGRGLVGVVAVVTRYFGGTKLGTGGLVRAYGGAVAAALNAARIVETPVLAKVRLRFAYELLGSVRGALHGFALEPGPAEYTADVRMEVAVPVERAQELAVALTEATAGRVEIG